jgi:hypothetical protein
MGVLSTRQYFDRADAGDSTVRALADSIYFRVDWPWARNGDASLTMGWHPETGFIASRWIGYNEAMLLYALAMGSPTIPSARRRGRRGRAGTGGIASTGRST